MSVDADISGATMRSIHFPYQVEQLSGHVHCDPRNEPIWRFTDLKGRHGPATLEGEVVSVCDAIAYVNHDIDDAIRGRVITLDDLPRDALALLGKTTSERINTMVVGLIEGSRDGQVGMVSQVLEATNMLRSHLYKHVYPCEAIEGEIRKARKLLAEMFAYLVENPDMLGAPGDPEDSVARRAVDLVAGMTDQYALHLYEKTFFPAAWRERG